MTKLIVDFFAILRTCLIMKKVHSVEAFFALGERIREYVMAHAQKPEFVFRRNGRVHSNQRGRQFSRLLAAEVYASAVVMLDTPCSEVV